MQNPKRFARELRKNLGFHPVWLPGLDISVGTVVIKDDGVYKPIDHVSSRGIAVASKPTKAIDIRFETKGVRTFASRAGGNIDTSNLKGPLEAKLSFEFSREDSFVLNATRCRGRRMTSPLSVARAIMDTRSTKWRFYRWFIVSRVYSAKQMVFLANRSKNAMIEFSGAGSHLGNVFNGNVHASLHISKRGSMGLEILGNEGGPVVMEVFRLNKGGVIQID